PEQHVGVRPATAAMAEAPAAGDPSAPAQSHMAWGDKIAWSRFEPALTTARSQHKSVCVVVYAEWCSDCKELAPVFNLPEVASAAADLVMVHQDQDQHPAWLQEQLGAYGNYVPRVLFLSPDGKVREDLTSGHPRYPYFYAPMVTSQLIANMRAASAL
ncbi:MAG TPA: thioredoxin family protein, partial [Polyangiales bacterium]